MKHIRNILNPKKTVVLSNCSSTRAPIVIQGEQIQFVNEASYLGTTISFPLDPSRELDRRIRSAWGAWSKIHHLMISPRLSMEEKRRAFDSLITPAALYGAELWSLRASDFEKLKTAQRKMERKMLRVTLLHRWSNERVRAETKLKCWAKTAALRKLRWADQLRRMPTDRWARILTEWTPYSHRRAPGHPRTRWRDGVERSHGTSWWSLSPSQFTARRDQLGPP